MTNKKPAIIVVSSHVVRGTVGNRAAAFALEVMGYPVWIVPTITLPWHPGHGPADRITAPAPQFDQLINDLTGSPWLGEVGAVLTGYLGHESQVDSVSRLVEAVKSENPNALYVLDPVIGDAVPGTEGRLYVSENQASAMRTQLLPRADLITPNPFELGWMANQSTPQSLANLQQAAQSIPTSMVLATSAPAMMQGHIGNLLKQSSQQGPKFHLAEHRLTQGPPNGLGDLAAAIMLGNLLSGKDPVKALSKTTASLHEVMMIASRARSDELMLEASVGSILNPRTPVNARILQSR